MRLKILPSLLALGISATGVAETIGVHSFKYAGPYAIQAPYMIDSVDVASHKYDVKARLATPISLDLVKKGREFNDSVFPAVTGDALHLVAFTLDNNHYAKAKINVSGVKNYELYVDGKKNSGGEMSLIPRTREVVVKCLADSSSADTLRVSVETATPQHFRINPTDGRRYTTDDAFAGHFLRTVSLSPSGKYLFVGYNNIDTDGKQSGWEYVVRDAATGRLIANRSSMMHWMPKSDLMYYTRDRNKKTQLVTYDPATGEENVLLSGLPAKHFTISPTEDFLIYNKEIAGPKEKNDGLYEILNPSDRQGGWRDRNIVMKYDFATGISTPLTFGYKIAYCNGLSDDGKKMLIEVSESNLGKRPSTLSSLYMIDLTTMKADTILEHEPFLGTVSLSPDGKTIAVQGSPEAFGGIGNVLPDGVVPSMVDNQLFVVDVDTRKVTPLTRDFDPSLEDMAWSRADGCIYFMAENRDARPLYRVNPKTGKIESLNVPEEYVSRFDVAGNAPVLAFFGQSIDNSSRLYTVDTKKLRSTLRHDLSAERTEGLRIEPSHDWAYKTSRGDTVYARYVLPDGFDPSLKYPVIVYYYGGCSPVSRVFDTTYNPHLFAANGFISLVINPSGATGFGQEYSSRHVATAGEGVAQDIIDGVKAFGDEFDFVNKDKIGCCGASYGGFMTQYLQTVTDIFAAAISHAGISDHTSYWGEGYWGHSYSHVSMGHKLPWSDRELYVGHSPLYNADKINTPLLFLHGDVDTNVPFGESVQMFTALKVLGKETAFVAAKDQDHHVLDYGKREIWLNTMLAWFNKYLQDDPTWWEDMYPTKKL
ncbi:MAG: prolyl oligopeptidase family serine peptidase [Duncaniella sp.]|nr:prolyl oligopeptidase family serine peptidase [Duncaniella sp.]